MDAVFLLKVFFQPVSYKGMQQVECRCVIVFPAFPEQGRTDVFRFVRHLHKCHTLDVWCQRFVFQYLQGWVLTFSAGPEDVEFRQHFICCFPSRQDCQFVGAHDEVNFISRMPFLDGTECFQGSSCGCISKFAGINGHTVRTHHGEECHSVFFGNYIFAAPGSVGFSGYIKVAGWNEDSHVGLYGLHGCVHKLQVCFGGWVERSTQYNNFSFNHGTSLLVLVFLFVSCVSVSG